MGGNPEQSELEKVFGKKEEALKAKEAQEKKEEEAKPAEEIIDEQQVTKSAEKAKLEIKTLFLSDESRKLILGALDKLLESQKSDVEQAGTKTREELKALFEGTKGKLDAFKDQPGVKEIYEPLSKLFANKGAYLNAINLEQYGIAGEGSEQGYWVRIQEELAKAGIGKEDIEKVQKILGLEQDGKVGPKTIEATWKLLTDKNKPVVNVIRQKGETVKVKEGEKLVEAILASDAEKEAKAKEELAKTQPEAPAVTPSAATESGKKATEKATEEVTEEKVREKFAQSYDYVKPEIIQKAQVTINEFQGYDGQTAHAIVATYVGENDEKVVYEGIYESPTANDYLAIITKKSNLNKYVQEGKETQLQAEPSNRIEISYLEEQVPVETKSVQRQGPRTAAEILKKEGGGWKETITGAEWNEILEGLSDQEQPMSSDMRKLAKLAGLIVLDEMEVVPIKANFDIINCSKIDKPTIEIARETGANAKNLKKIEEAINKGELPANMAVPSPKAGSIMVAFDQGEWVRRMTVFTETGPKEVKCNGTLA